MLPLTYSTALILLLKSQLVEVHLGAAVLLLQKKTISGECRTEFDKEALNVSMQESLCLNIYIFYKQKLNLQ